MSTRKTAALLALALSLSACQNGSGLGYSLNTPPLALVPANSVGVQDDRGRFRSQLCAIAADHGGELPHNRPCAESLQSLADEPPSPPVGAPGPDAFRDIRLVIVPGIFGECVARYALPFSDAQTHLAGQHGLTSMDWIPVSGRSSSAANAATIAAWLAEHPTPAGHHLVLLGYSKGATDLIETLTRFPDAVPAGTPIIGVASVVSGTPVADRGASLYQALSRLPVPDCKPGDGDGVESLTRRERLNWLAEYPMPERYRYYSLAAFARPQNISAALAPFNNLLRSHDARNDGQVLFQDAIIPGSHLLGYANADHWAITLPLHERLNAKASSAAVFLVDI